MCQQQESLKVWNEGKTTDLGIQHTQQAMIEEQLLLFLEHRLAKPHPQNSMVIYF